ncbi:MAG: UDP-N-acetylmuramoyl-L-alanine--D-glutamate ligase [Christensenellales bacterium]
MNYKDKNVLIVGMAKSGVASASLLCRLGAVVTANDRKKESELSEAVDSLKDCPIKWRLGEDPVPLLQGKEILLISPVVPMHSPVVQAAKKMGIFITGEIELGYECAKADFVAITGTNGKTTTTALTGEMFLDAGFHTFVLGNIGVPIAQEALNTKPGDVVVAEVAALQLETTHTFKPRVAAFLNITDDHLDRYGTMENYISAKLHIFKNQDENDIAVLNYDDEIVRGFHTKAKAAVLYFSRKEIVKGAYAQNGEVYLNLTGKPVFVCTTGDIKIRGAHNLENALSAVACAGAMGISPASMRQTLMQFPGVEHRIEFVREVNGVRFINDSKGTNPDSTVKAIEAMDRPTVLLLGGSDKKLDFMPVFRVFGNTVTAVVALGEVKQQILDTAREADFLNIVSADTFPDAVMKAYALARPGGNVLLSPACASFDMFHDYEERGRIFKDIANSIGG